LAGRALSGPRHRRDEASVDQETLVAIAAGRLLARFHRTMKRKTVLSTLLFALVGFVAYPADTFSVPPDPDQPAQVQTAASKKHTKRHHKKHRKHHLKPGAVGPNRS